MRITANTGAQGSCVVMGGWFCHHQVLFVGRHPTVTPSLHSVRPVTSGDFPKSQEIRISLQLPKLKRHGSLNENDLKFKIKWETNVFVLIWESNPGLLTPRADARVI